MDAVRRIAVQEQVFTPLEPTVPSPGNQMTEIRVVRVLRGELLAGTVIQMDLKRTNRSRSRSLDPKATKLKAQQKQQKQQ